MKSLVMEESSGNVFADIGVPDPIKHKDKADVVIAIRGRILQNKLTLTRAAKLMGVSDLELARINQGRFRKYSIECLRRFLADVS